MKLKENLIKITNYFFLKLDQAYSLIIEKIFKFRLFRDLLVYIILAIPAFILTAIPFVQVIFYLWFFAVPVIYLLMLLIRILNGRFVLHIFFNFVFILAVSLIILAMISFTRPDDLGFGYFYAGFVLIVGLGYTIYWLINFYRILKFLHKKYFKKSDQKNVVK
jgi:hypothetical protein